MVTQARPRGRFGRTRALLAATVAALSAAAWSGHSLAAPSDGVSFTLEGCRNNGDISLPNAGGKFICPDAAYTTGNLGKGWNELDLVPYRITTSAGNSAPASQTYSVGIVVDNKDDGKPGYDVLSAPVLNTALSSAGCTAASSGGELIASPGLGGTDESRYRILTITQPKNTTCVYDYFARLALGSHLYPGSSLHANLTNEVLTTAGVGSKEVSIPVKEIEPQDLDKDMTATADASHVWNLTKEGSDVAFGDVCRPDFTGSEPVTITVKWTKLAAGQAGTVTVVTNIYATNPASRPINVTVSDTIYAGTTQTTALHTQAFPEVTVPAGTTQLVATHTTAVAGSIGGFLNDVATATYVDQATGIPVPGNTTAAAQAQIEQGSTLNTTAAIADTESLAAGAVGLKFAVAQPALGAFVGSPAYTAGTQTVGPVDWAVAGQTDSGQVSFAKTVFLDGKRVVDTLLSDTASLVASDGFTTDKTLAVKITSGASVKLTIEKTIPALLGTNEKIDVPFTVTRSGDATFSKSVTISFVGGGPLTLSEDVTGLVPDSYTVTEGTPTFTDANGTTGPAGITPVGGDQRTVDLSQNATTGVITACSGTAKFENALQGGFPQAQVQKITNPALAGGDPDFNWTFTLKGPGLPAGGYTTVAGANAGFTGFLLPPGNVDLVQLTQEGTYTVTETTKTGWDLTTVSPTAGNSVCSFTVDFPQDLGKTFQCTFTNVKRGKAAVVKTVSGTAPTGSTAFTFQLRQGASTTQNGTTLESLIANAGNGGQLAFTTLLVPGNTYQLCEIVAPGWLTNLGTFVPGSFMPPDGVAVNPDVDNSILCADFSVAAGETKTFTVDNTPPPGGRALTIGFWKNWASCKASGGKQAPTLDRTLFGKTIEIGNVKSVVDGGDYLRGGVVADKTADCPHAVALLNKSDFSGKKKASDPLFNMAAQLVAAKLNLAAGAGFCPALTTAVTTADALLNKYNFTGFGYTGPLSGADAASANTTAGALDSYNNNKLCN